MPHRSAGVSEVAGETGPESPGAGPVVCKWQLRVVLRPLEISGEPPGELCARAVLLGSLAEEPEGGERLAGHARVLEDPCHFLGKPVHLPAAPLLKKKERQV